MQVYISLIKSHQKQILQITLSLLFVALGIYFLRHEQTELLHVRETLYQASSLWVLSGLILVLAFVAVQGIMYQISFRAIHQHIGLWTGINLYLKRNLVSVFLPAGLVTNMLFFNKEVEQKESVSKTEIYFASSIFTFCSILSAILIGLPALLWLYLKSEPFGHLTLGIATTTLVLGGLAYVVYNIVQKGKIYQWVTKRSPVLMQLADQLAAQVISRRHLWQVVLWSCVIEVIGIIHLYIAIKAFGADATMEAAVIGYALVLLLLMSSPFLRGIGAIEVTLTYVLTLFGFATVTAISITFLFRFFEFWLLLALGALAFLANRDNLIVRIFPAFLLFALGIVSIISALTPALPQRLAVLKEVLPLEAIHASVYLVLFTGILMLSVAVYLLKGLRSAWIIAIVLSLASLIAHLAKGIDWEESIIALLALASLLAQRNQYFIQTDLKLARRTWFPALVVVLSVWIFGTLAFFLLDASHFNVDFTIWEAFRETITTFFLLNLDLTPATTFGKEFLLGMQVLGGITLSYVAFTLLRPYISRLETTVEEEHQLAKLLVEKYGSGSMEYFKTYEDKKYWFSEDKSAFVAFKTSNNYAIALENPVCADAAKMERAIRDYDNWAQNCGLRAAYYRVPETQREIYQKAGKNLLPIGEEATVNLTNWTLQGRSKKSLRNAINKINKEGIIFKVNKAPQKDGFLQQLKTVSDDWLKDMQRQEISFSQGVFKEAELKKQVILTAENQEGKVIAFINLIPDYSPGRANFDLMRKIADAPNGVMDFLLVQLFEYLKNKGFSSCNIGMVPMSGIKNPENMQERVIKMAYERMKQFGNYKSLRDFKEKFEPDWTMMYFAYGAPFDLLYLPTALEQVIQYKQFK